MIARVFTCSGECSARRETCGASIVRTDHLNALLSSPPSSRRSIRHCLPVAQSAQERFLALVLPRVVQGLAPALRRRVLASGTSSGSSSTATATHHTPDRFALSTGTLEEHHWGTLRVSGLTNPPAHRSSPHHAFRIPPQRATTFVSPRLSPLYALLEAVAQLLSAGAATRICEAAYQIGSSLLSAGNRRAIQPLAGSLAYLHSAAARTLCREPLKAWISQPLWSRLSDARYRERPSRETGPDRALSV